MEKQPCEHALIILKWFDKRVQSFITLVEGTEVDLENTDVQLQEKISEPFETTWIFVLITNKI